jgi:hypothetical protein
MRLFQGPAMAAIALMLAACGGGDTGVGDEAGANQAAAEAAGNAAGTEAANESASAAASALAGCPFRATTGWNGSIEGGQLLVNGRVDLQMAGFRPTLTPQGGGGDTLRLDLTLAPEPQAAVTDRVRYEGSGRYRRGEIWCGGERIADFDFILIE